MRTVVVGRCAATPGWFPPRSRLGGSGSAVDAKDRYWQPQSQPLASQPPEESGGCRSLFGNLPGEGAITKVRSCGTNGPV